MLGCTATPKARYSRSKQKWTRILLWLKTHATPRLPRVDSAQLCVNDEHQLAPSLSFTFIPLDFASLYAHPSVLCARVIDAAKAKAIQGSAGAPSEGEKDAHELLRTLVWAKHKEKRRE